MSAQVKNIIYRFLMVFMLISTLVFNVRTAHAYANGVEVTLAKIESTEDGYRASVGFAFELSHELKEAINDGIPISFTAEVEINRPRWYWFDEKTIRSSQTVKIAYDLWRRQYTAAINGGLKQNFTSLDDAMKMVLRPRRWNIASKSELTPGATYNVAIRLKLDINELSRPMLITSFSNSDWRLASEWKKFTFKAEDK